MEERSCLNCPNLVRPDDSYSVYGYRLDYRTCRATGAIVEYLGEASLEVVAVRLAADCSQYGIPSGRCTRPEMAVAVPVSVRRSENKVASCAECQHFVSADVAINQVKLPLCRATGRLLLQSALEIEALRCSFAAAGAPPQPDRAAPVKLQYPYSKSRSKAAVKAAATPKENIDPREYPSDRPVSAYEAGLGIRAWRAVSDPEGLRDPQWLPIFDGQRLCGFDPRSTYGSHAPHLYKDHGGLLYDAAAILFDLDYVPLLQGQAGTGKTEFACYLAYLMDLPFTRISVHKGTEPSHLLGEYTLVLEEGQTVMRFKKGRYAKAYSEPGVLVVDEPNLNQAIFEFCRAQFDGARQLEIPQTGELVQRHQFLFLVAAQNPVHDVRYEGVEPVSPADVDRLTVINFEMPPEDIERDIIRGHCAADGYKIDIETLDTIMRIASDLRNAIDAGALPIVWGLRSQIQVAKLTKVFSIPKSYRRSIVDFLEPAVADAVMGIVRSHT